MAVLLAASLMTFIVHPKHQELCFKVSFLGFRVHWLLGFRSHYFSLLSFKRAVEEFIKKISKSIRLKTSLNTTKNIK